jgi:hypothetical protein
MDRISDSWQCFFQCQAHVMGRYTNTRARAGHRDDSVSSPTTCGKDAMVRKARFATLSSHNNTVNWLEAHQTLSISVHGKLKSATREFSSVICN